jgi:hypothetical protein
VPKPVNLLDLPAGEALRDKGVERVSRGSPGFLYLMREKAREICRIKGEVCSDDLRVYAAGEGIKPRHPNAWGAVFRESGWEAVGAKKSKVPSCHARMIRIWQWVG